VSKYEVQVFCVPRSGSTLVRGMLVDLLPCEVPPQTHDSDQLSCRKLVIVYRDFRNAAASYWRVTTGKFDREVDRRVASPKEVGEAVDYINKIAERMHRLDHDCCLRLRYESFVEQQYRLALLLAVFTEHDIRATDILGVADNWAKDRVRMTAMSRDGWLDWDKQYQIHGLHVYEAETNWREMFPPETHDMVNGRLGKHLKRWGYKEL
jgi:hypothetical protein